MSNIFLLYDKTKSNLTFYYSRNLKPQSSPRLSASPSSAGSGKTGGSSKARQKKFHRHFQQVAEEERVINCKARNCN